MKPTLGTYTDPPGQARIDLPRLLETKLLLQAGSGFGKSWALRRILEQTYAGVQQIVVDPEGEFSTLRERDGYVLAAVNGGDVVAHPRTAGLLARRLVELKVSAVLDISELKKPERRRFVRLFLEELMGLPRAMWTPLLVALDEAHEFAPEKDESESLSAVIDLATRGRKRGYSLLAATQRIGKFSKDAAAELHNKLIGFTSLDIDVKRAAFELGMTPTQALAELRTCEPGDFFAIGPALTPTIRRLRVGDVATTHPRPGTRKLQTPPKPTAEIIAVLPKLADLPKEAEQEQKTLEDLRRELAGVRRELTIAKRAQPTAPPARPSKDEVLAAEARGIARGVALAAKEVKAIMPGLRQDIIGSIRSRSADMIGDAEGALTGLLACVSNAAQGHIAAVPENPERRVFSSLPEGHASGSEPGNTRAARLHRQIDGTAASNGDRPPVQQRVLDALAELEQIGAEQPAREMVAFMAGYSHLQSTGFVKAMGGLRTAGLIDYPPHGGTVALTDAGRAAATQPERPRTAEELQERVVSMLGGATARILRPLLAAYPKALDRSEVASAAGYGHLQSTGFVKAMGKLRTLGFIDYPDRGSVVAKPVLFLQ